MEKLVAPTKMKYKFSPALHIDYNDLKDYVQQGEELTKKELLEKCCGNISRELLQYIRELEFDLIGKLKDGELYIK
ncbi:MAG: hypothetical protein ACXWCT_15495 [Flavitalea sp.]